ncbi:class C sortase [Varibaculum cambriense]|uniref:class C sortase n=1 Tax=Varibaculum cambriense TaxID=184870 RepID=UPI0039F59169
MQPLPVDQQVASAADDLDQRHLKSDSDPKEQDLDAQGTSRRQDSASASGRATGTPEGAKRSRIPDLAFIAVFVGGMLVFFYPTISNYWNTLQQGRAIAEYTQTVNKMHPGEIQQTWDEAEAYNRELLSNPARYHLSHSQMQRYLSLLDVGKTGMMGHIEIEKLGVDLPIYHGTEDSVLQVGAGHVPGSSLPTGGTGTHTILSGHRGLPSAKLFTNLDELEEGDRFVLHVLDRDLAYQVDQIRVVEPKELSNLKIIPGQDYATLVTCTPYAINTHRLLVRGHRVPYGGDAGYVAADAVAMDPVMVSLAISVPVLGIIVAITVTHLRRRRNQAGGKTETL